MILFLIFNANVASLFPCRFVVCRETPLPVANVESIDPVYNRRPPYLSDIPNVGQNRSRQLRGPTTVSKSLKAREFVAWCCRSCCVIHPSISQSTKKELNNNPSSVYFPLFLPARYILSGVFQVKWRDPHFLFWWWWWYNNMGAHTHVWFNRPSLLYLSVDRQKLRDIQEILSLLCTVDMTCTSRPVVYYTVYRHRLCDENYMKRERDEKTEAARADASSSPVTQNKSLLMPMIMNETLLSRKNGFFHMPNFFFSFFLKILWTKYSASMCVWRDDPDQRESLYRTLPSSHVIWSHCVVDGYSKTDFPGGRRKMLFPAFLARVFFCFFVFFIF